ncbi:MAG: sulfatase [Gaiellaceae bacterium]
MNVLFVLVDAFRADRASGLDRRCKTPVLDELRRRSSYFTNAFAPASMTTCCTASILTGTYPFVHGIRSLADARLRPDLPTLAERFREAGYNTWAEVTGPLAPMTGLDRGFDEYTHRDYSDTLDTSWGETLIQRLTAETPSPWFGFLHLWELHNPRRVMPEYDRAEFGSSLYDRAVSSLDAQLGRLLVRLPEDTALVLTGDHGEYVSDSRIGTVVGRLKKPLKQVKRHVPGARKLRRFMPLVLERADRMRGGRGEATLNWLGHGYHVYDYLVHVPLLLHGPSLFPRGTEYQELVSHVDLFPTLVSAFGLSGGNGSSLSGRDLTPVLRGTLDGLDGFHDRAIYVEASGGRTTPSPDQWLTGVRTPQYKYVRGLFNEELPEELYDLAGDPSEQTNLVDRQPQLAAELRDRLHALTDASSEEPEIDTSYTPEQQAELERRLTDLGYLE